MENKIGEGINSKIKICGWMVTQKRKFMQCMTVGWQKHKMSKKMGGKIFHSAHLRISNGIVLNTHIASCHGLKNTFNVFRSHKSKFMS